MATEYCTAQDIENRLTAVGMLSVADRNKDGVITETEYAMYITPPIQYAGNVIDGFICGQLIPAAARGAGSTWLRDRAIDIATHQACCNGGREAPKSVVALLEFTMKLLQGVMDGNLIPGYPYPGPANAHKLNHGPKVANLCRSSRFGQPRGNWPYY